MASKKKPDDQPEENNDENAGNDDTFGLPEIEYEPINRESPPAEEVRSPEPEPVEQINQPEYTEEQPVTNTPMERDEVRQTEYTSTYYDDDEYNSPWPKILGILAVLIILGGAGWYFWVKKPNDEAAAREKAQQEEQARQDAARVEEDRIAEQNRIAAENQRRADSLANATPAVGTIETLNERTGRYYVVIASAIDGDLLMDYAKELSGKGVNAKIIPPYGNVKFHRLTVAEGETFATTAQTAEQLKSEYTEGAWVIKY
jgi:hypothetical protein